MTLSSLYLCGAALAKSLTKNSLQSSGTPEQISSGNSKHESGLTKDRCISTSKGSPFLPDHGEK